MANRLTTRILKAVTAVLWSNLLLLKALVAPLDPRRDLFLLAMLYDPCMEWLRKGDILLCFLCTGQDLTLHCQHFSIHKSMDALELAFDVSINAKRGSHQRSDLESLSADISSVTAIQVLESKVATDFTKYVTKMGAAPCTLEIKGLGTTVRLKVRPKTDYQRLTLEVQHSN